MFISRDNKFINIKNELLGYWKDFHEKIKSDQSLVAELEEELLSRTMKEAKVVGGLTSGFGIDLSESKCLSLIQDKTILSKFCINQDPNLFLSNLGMTSLENISKDQFNNLQRTLIEILKERSIKYHSRDLTTSNKKL